jgi:hypothetical protein
MQLDWRRLKFSPVIVLAFLVVVVADYAIRGPRAKQRKARIEQELRSIPDPASSKLIDAGSAYKTSGGYAMRIFQTDLATNEIESYYRMRLEQNGWFFYRENVILSRRRQIFCNGNNEATVLVTPENVIEKPYEYSLTISWNSTEGCN